MKPSLALALALTAVACRRPAATDPRPQRAATTGDTGAHAAAPTPSPAPTPVGAPETAPARPAAPGPAWQPPSSQALAAMPLARRVELSVVPFDEATAAHVRAVFRAGASAGLRPDVFAKLGDSITESGSYLKDIGHGWYELGAWSRLEPVVQYFRRHSFTGDPENNSFSRSSVSAEAGWTSRALLHADDGRSPLDLELDATRAAFAIVMTGTNDAERSTAEVYEHNLREVIARVEGRHVVLVLSTVPDQMSSDEAGRRGLEINGVIRRLAAEHHLPLVDYWAAMQGLPHQGIDPDNVHPSVYVAGNRNVATGVLTEPALAFGYNVRNLQTLVMLERLTQLLSLR
jgi:hypothetical protein